MEIRDIVIQWTLMKNDDVNNRYCDALDVGTIMRYCAPFDVGGKR